MGRDLSPAETLALVPQQEPFRFIETIDELDREHIVASYRFPEDADFYRGHFPGNPITPGVILVEAMAQAGVVAQGIYLYALKFDAGELEKIVTVFTDASVEFTGTVKPGQRVTTTGRVKFFRHKKLRAEVEMKLDDGKVVCSGELAGMGVPR
ncbi:MAG: beta-hydroxyacyl-ACP dehydratase [Deltaproteobacteria bacterium]|nr:beta-hydroxyacyl-ACP dehydratase [Deltaproteobacteria bacterium]MBW2382827.1 beta-hydroxyacyl-ACP dehydratase [Deltaproteobacteria bacterium]MBW2695053.1 beta-hydroxyacyl-ACP dehydratase [Deltaproteobacteria bacterium]